MAELVPPQSAEVENGGKAAPNATPVDMLVQEGTVTGQEESPAEREPQIGLVETTSGDQQGGQPDNDVAKLKLIESRDKDRAEEETIRAAATEPSPLPSTNPTGAAKDIVNSLVELSSRLGRVLAPPLLTETLGPPERSDVADASMSDSSDPAPPRPPRNTEVGGGEAAAEPPSFLAQLSNRMFGTQVGSSADPAPRRGLMAPIVEDEPRQQRFTEDTGAAYIQAHYRGNVTRKRKRRPKRATFADGTYGKVRDSRGGNAVPRLQRESRSPLRRSSRVLGGAFAGMADVALEFFDEATDSAFMSNNKARARGSTSDVASDTVEDTAAPGPAASLEQLVTEPPPRPAMV
jgi:hypothetical protein